MMKEKRNPTCNSHLPGFSNAGRETSRYSLTDFDSPMKLELLRFEDGRNDRCSVRPKYETHDEARKNYGRERMRSDGKEFSSARERTPQDI